MLAGSRAALIIRNQKVISRKLFEVPSEIRSVLINLPKDSDPCLNHVEKLQVASKSHCLPEAVYRNYDDFMSNITRLYKQITDRSSHQHFHLRPQAPGCMAAHTVPVDEIWGI